jgi:GT2 family glycosyltransferase
LKPLTIITTYNRIELTKQTLSSLEPVIDRLDLVIVDNGSDPEAAEWLANWGAASATMIFNQTNVGCPKALNQALLHRTAGQPVIKFDNDIRVLSEPDWLEELEWFLTRFAALGTQVAMVSAYYQPAAAAGSGEARRVQG